jgi:hypothetical protein
MENNIIIALKKFIASPMLIYNLGSKKLDKDFIKDKECLICLELFEIDLEINKIVKLPCECSNSVYHINCIIKLLQSGVNKNFCPHCKTKYQIHNNNNNNQELNNNNQELNNNNQELNNNNQELNNNNQELNNNNQELNNNNQELNNNNNNQELKYNIHILVFHVLSNTRMNFINISLCGYYTVTIIENELKVLVIFYFSKVFFNYCIFIYSDISIENIEIKLTCSYIFSIILFIFLIYLVSKINDTNNIFIILNNILFMMIDMLFKIIIKYKIQNRVGII